MRGSGFKVGETDMVFGDLEIMRLPNVYMQHKLAAARDLPPSNEPFAAINVGFHEAYMRLVDQVVRSNSCSFVPAQL